jgi:hypothetical protein
VAGTGGEAEQLHPADEHRIMHDGGDDADAEKGRELAEKREHGAD